MFLSMGCSCGAELEVGNSEDDTNDVLISLWGQQFVNAHVPCGYMSKPVSQAEIDEMKRLDSLYKDAGDDI